MKHLPGPNTPLLGLGLLLVVLALGYLLVGLDPAALEYQLSRRFPLLLVALLGGAASSLGALTFQTLGRNPLLSPGFLGVDALYYLSHTVVLALVGNSGGSWIAALGVSLLVGFGWLAYLGGRLASHGNLERLLLEGIVFTGLFFAGTGLFQKTMDPASFMVVQSQTLPRLKLFDLPVLLTLGIPLLGFIVLIIGRHRRLDIMGLGHVRASNLGLDFRKELLGLVFVGGGLALLATALTGPLPLLGLVGASIARFLQPGQLHRQVLPGAALAGASVLLISQILSERIFTHELSLGTLVDGAGAIICIYLLLRRKSQGA